MRVREKASADNWTEEKLKSVLDKIQHQRQTQGLPKMNYEDPVPELKKITDFLDPSSEEDMEDYRITRVGQQFQAKPPTFGEMCRPNIDCYKIWDSRRLPAHVVENYIKKAKDKWEESYLNLKTFNEQDACTILHMKGYDVNLALEAIQSERLPYIIVAEYDKSTKEQDIDRLKQGQPLTQR